MNYILKNKIVFFLIILSAYVTLQGVAQKLKPVFPGKEWKQISKPELAGFSTSKLQIAKRFADNINTAAVMIVINGKHTGIRSGKTLTGPGYSVN